MTPRTSGSVPAASAPAPAAAKARPPLRRRMLGWALELALVIAIVAGVQWWRNRDLVASGESAPALNLPSMTSSTLDAGMVDLASLRGKPVMVHFWATWCTVCKTEFGSLRTLHEQAEARGYRLITVVDETDSGLPLQAFLREHRIPYPVLMGDRETLEAWNIDVFPTDYIIDSEGRISATHTGFSTIWGMRWRLWWAG
jgi:peroxiredoxin